MVLRLHLVVHAVLGTRACRLTGRWKQQERGRGSAGGSSRRHKSSGRVRGGDVVWCAGMAVCWCVGMVVRWSSSEVVWWLSLIHI